MKFSKKRKEKKRDLRSPHPFHFSLFKNILFYYVYNITYNYYIVYYYAKKVV